MGEVWDLEKRQLLLDTVLNDFDMPKLYFHEFEKPKLLDDGRVVQYAVIDGRQRLEAIYGFIDGKFPLDQTFNLMKDPQVQAGGFTYADLGKEYPNLKTHFDSYVLPITTVMTDDLDLIEEMFSRLNEAVPLNAAEKRNAMGGPMANVIRQVSAHPFFASNIPFSNKRYQHREVAAKFLLLSTTDTVGDTKKVYLDDMVKAFRRGDKQKEAAETGRKVTAVLDWGTTIFTNHDPLLRTHAMTVVYFQVFKDAMAGGWEGEITRQKLQEFETLRVKNRQIAGDDIAKATYELLEFDRMHQQGTNDKSSIEFRVNTLKKFLLESEAAGANHSG